MRRALPAFVALLMACSGGTPAPGSSPTTATTPTAAATKAPGGFADLVRAGTTASFKITYRYSVTAEGQSSAVEQTWYVKGANVRWDLASPLGSSSSFFFLPDGAYQCVIAGQASCLKLPAAQGAQQNAGALLQDQVRENPERFNAAPLSTRTIAGIEAQCFAVKDPTVNAPRQGTMCYSARGFPLYTQFKDTSVAVLAGNSLVPLEFTMEAVRVGTASDADFKLPAPVRSFP